jgi:hypothetical protein
MKPKNLKPIHNASQEPQVYYGLHLAPGVAEYKENILDLDSKQSGEPTRILLTSDFAKRMDPSFAGKPVYVRHVEDVNLQNLQEEADGYVFKSFYNPLDGMHWVQFVVVSDKGHAAILNGEVLSNAWLPKDFVAGGKYHGVDFDAEMVDGEYTHLAIVPNPRYKESIVLTPDEYKEYCEEKKVQLAAVTNAETKKDQGAGKMDILKVFKKAKVENSEEISKYSITLPKAKVTKTIEQIVNELDTILAAQNAGEMVEVNPKHMVKIHDGSEMSVGDLVQKHKAVTDMYNELLKEVHPDEEHTDNDDDDDDGDGDDDKDLEEHLDEEHTDNDDDDDDDDSDDEDGKGGKKVVNKGKKKTAMNADVLRHKKALKKAKALMNAGPSDIELPQMKASEEFQFETAAQQVARGKKKYGSTPSK